MTNATDQHHATASPGLAMWEVGIFAGFGAAIALGLKHFSPWVQVEAVFASSDPIAVALDSLGRNEVHALRKFLMALHCQISMWLGIDPRSAFPAAVWLALWRTSVWTRRAAVECGTASAAWAIAPLWVGLGFQMNGRLAFAFWGASLLLTLAIRRAQERVWWPAFVVQVAWALWLMSVSSGCFAVGMLFVATLAVLEPVRALPLIPHYVLRTSVGYLILFGALLFHLLAGIDKNLRYHSGSFFMMLTHGPGRILLSMPAILLAAMPATILGIPILHAALRSSFAILPVLVLMAAASTIGVFGRSTLLTGLPAIMVIMCLATHYLTNAVISTNAAVAQNNSDPQQNPGI